MASVSRSALVMYSAQQMYDLVADVDSYHKFLPWCGDSRVLKQLDDEVEACILVSKAGIERAFTTRNRMEPGQLVEISLVEGPFRHLDGYWRFHALREDACKVTLDLEYEFSSKVFTMAFGTVFTQIANTLVDAFVKRAKDVYG